MSTVKTILMLQTYSGPFFSDLAGALLDRGHVVLKVHFNGGDLFYWKHKKHPNCKVFTHKGGPYGCRTLCDRLFQEFKIDELIAFGERRPVHRLFIERAKAEKVHLSIFELGYLRPNWVTCENFGTNALSLIDEKTVHNTLLNKQNTKKFMIPKVGRWNVIKHGFCYSFASLVLKFRFGNYTTHRTNPLITDLFCGLKNVLQLLFNYKAVRKARERCIKEKNFFLVPLQLDDDYQIREFSHYLDQSFFLDEVLSSFSKNTDSKTKLLIKLHPYYLGKINYQKVVDQLADEYGLKGRVLITYGGCMRTLVEEAKGIITINSTVGLLAVSLFKKTICMGRAIYDRPKLVYEGSINDFWCASFGPDKSYVQRFIQYLKNEKMLIGNVHSAEGRALCISHYIKKHLF